MGHFLRHLGHFYMRKTIYYNTYHFLRFLINILHKTGENDCSGFINIASNMILPFFQEKDKS